jgi:hypothetical protein
MQQPDLLILLNDFEAIGGPELYGPEGTMILIALWRKSMKLGWLQTFTMTNTELQVQTGIKSRDTLNLRRMKLVEGGLISYIPPPRGKSRGHYNLYFKVAGEPVRNSDNFGGNFTKVAGEPVRNSDNFADTVLDLDLKDVVVIDVVEKNTFDDLMNAFCEIHGKLDINIRPLDITLMQELITLGVPIPLMIRVMGQVYKDRTSKGGKISTFSYYKDAISNAWENEKAITIGVPIPGVTLGPETTPAQTGTVTNGHYPRKSKPNITSGQHVPGAEETRQRLLEQEQLEQLLKEQRVARQSASIIPIHGEGVGV